MTMALELLGGAAWDVAHHTGGRGGYVLEWYPMLCVGFDLFLAGYLVGTALSRERSGGRREGGD